MRRLMLKVFVAVLFVTVVAAALAEVDAASAPEEKRFISENKLYAVDLISASDEYSQCHPSEDEVKNNPDAEAANATRNRRCMAVFYIAQNGFYYPQISFPLTDEESMPSALVSNSGQYMVTFGDGPHTVVIYRTDGTLIKQLAPRDFLAEDDVSAVVHYDGSVILGAAHYLDEENGLLLLKFSGGVLSLDPDESRFYEVRIELSSGNLTEPKRSFILWSGPDGELPESPNTLREETGQPCVGQETKADAAEPVYVASSKLFNRATARVMPPYPPVAKAARASGTVVVEVLVDEKGSVCCARIISGHPLLQAAAKQAALKWKFAPLDAFGHPVKMIGTIAFHFGRIRPAQQ